MKRDAFVMAAALALALAAVAAQAGGKLGIDPGRNGTQLNGVPASGFAVETVQLPGGTMVTR